MKIAITGGSGLIGAYVVTELVANSAHVITVVDLAPPPLMHRVHWVRAHITDLGQVLGTLHGSDAVIHLAAVSRPGGVPDQEVFRTNVIGTFNVHEAASRLGIRRVVSTSSVAALGWPYGERPLLPSYLPIDEDHPASPTDPYGLSKLCGEQIARSYALKADLETVVLRLARVLVPEAAVELRRQGGSRPTTFNLCAYVDVRDVAKACRQAVELPELGHHLVFVVADDSVSYEPLSVLFPRIVPELGDMAQSLTGQRSSITNQRVKELLRWRPVYSWRTEPI